MSRLQTIRAKLEELRQRDRNLVVFCAKAHKHQLNPPLSDREIRRFEREFGAALPDDFAAFVTEVGDGGAGPEYGIFRLSTIADGIRSFDEYCRDKNRRILRLDKPFPFTSADARSLIEQAKEEPDEVPTLSVPEYSGADGEIFICEYGCDLGGHLVVTGEQRGNVWHAEGGQRWCPSTTDSERMDFLSWYEAWLDHCLAPGVIDEYAKLGI